MVSLQRKQSQSQRVLVESQNATGEWKAKHGVKSSRIALNSYIP